MSELKAIKDVKEGDGRAAYARSGITSPYFDLAASVAVAQAIQHQGGGTASPEQLAHWLGYKSTSSGTYLTRVSAATKHFGLVATSGDNLVLTERAKAIISPVMPEDATTAKVEAFLSVPLFARVYEQFRGQQLPPEVGLKNLFLNTHKVVPDRVSQAVRVFLNSAEQSGFFQQTGGDRSRLIKPTLTQPNAAAQSHDSNSVTPAKTDSVPQDKPRMGGGDGNAGGVDTAIIGLLRKLPAQGDSWTIVEQTRFLTAFTHTIQFLYPAEDEGK